MHFEENTVFCCAQAQAQLSHCLHLWNDEDLTAASLPSLCSSMSPAVSSKHGNKLSEMSKKIRSEMGAESMWSSLLKSVENNLGSDVVIFFTQILWLLYTPLLGFFVVVCFIVAPQLYYRFEKQSPRGYEINKEMQWHDFFTGKNWLEETELFQGYYFYDYLPDSDYSMPTAYLLASLVAYGLYLLLIVRSLSDAWSQQYVERDVRRKSRRDEGSGHAAPNVFTAWDFSVCKKETADVRRAFVREEMLKFVRQPRGRQEEQRTNHARLFINFGINLILYTLIVTACAGIWFVALHLQINQTPQSLLGLPLMTSLVSMLMPVIFRIFKQFEKYTSRITKLLVSMARLSFLQLGLFTTIVFYLISKVKCNEIAAPGAQSSFSKVCNLTIFPRPVEALGIEANVRNLKDANITCWETWIGQEIYRWQIVDIAVVFLVSLVLLSVHKFVSLCSKFRGPAADVPQLLVHLCLTQSLAWFGSFFCPLLPVVMVIKYFILFFLFRFLLILCCRPSYKPWQSQPAGNFFRYFITFSFLASFASMLAALIVLKPSSDCGPFRGLDSIVKALPGPDLKGLKEGKYGQLALTFLNSLGFNIFMTVCLTVLLLIFRRKALQKSETLRRLRRTIQMIRKDNAYYVRMLQENARRNPYQMLKAIQSARRVSRAPSDASLSGARAPASAASAGDSTPAHSPDASPRPSGRTSSEDATSSRRALRRATPPSRDDSPALPLQPMVAFSDGGDRAPAQPMVAFSDGGDRAPAEPMVAFSDGGDRAPAQPMVAFSDGDGDGSRASTPPPDY